LVYTPIAAEQVLSTAMATTWISFAKNANLNNAFIPSWRRHDSAADSDMQFNDVVKAEAGIHTANCDFWDGIDDSN
jgi:hypothetical protein